MDIATVARRRPGPHAAASIAILAMWIAKTNPPPQERDIVQYCRDNFEIKSRRQAIRIMSHARELLRTAHGRSFADLKAESLCRVESMAKDTSISARDRIRAETRLAYLLGMDAPRQVELAVAHVDAQQSIRKLNVQAIVDVQQRVLAISNDNAMPQQQAIDTPSEVKQLPAVIVPPEDAAPSIPTTHTQA